MRILIQRVSQASVTIQDQVVAAIGQGFLILIGIQKDDNQKMAEYLAKKVSNLRIFEDENHKLNLSVQDIKGQILVVSQFTLAGDTSRGNRPGFETAAKPELAKPLYEYFVECLKSYGIITKTGVFQADMQVSLINDGPVTFLLEKN